MSRPLSLNQATTKYWTLAETVRGCVDAGIPALGVWRDRLTEIGVDKAKRLLDETGVVVTSLCRGGFFTAPDGSVEDNRRAVEECAAIDCPVLVLVCGGLPDGSRDLVGARARVRDGIAALAPYAAERGVRLAIEPMHPMFCSDRGVISTLGQSIDLAAEFPAEQVGVVVDSYHIWWDPEVERQIARAAGRISLVQVSDWVTPLPAGALLGRGHVGDGHIDNRRLVDAAYAAGYHGYVEVEIFNEEIWSAPGEQTVATVVERHRQAFG
ncbi:MAG TPA: sugar phosphate isomerase/epimerase family protein [Mycobacteriales bacterium]|jgi:sugar phosphate isomerase/epimerase|nr:sugar phosphate isomerase/epimerase family protein [Mycobacteriales bacterium]